MSALTVRMLSRRAVAITTGHDSFFRPINLPVTNGQLHYDKATLAADICGTWYDGVGAILGMHGDVAGYEFDGGLSGGGAASIGASVSHVVHVDQPTIAASTLNGEAGDTILVDSVAGWNSGGYIHDHNGQGPAGWTALAYASITTITPGSKYRLNNVALISGSGNITAGDAIAHAEPRKTTSNPPNAGLRGNVQFTSTDTDLAAGMTIDDYYPLGAGQVAQEPFPFAFASTPLATMYLPIQTGYAIASIKRENGFVTAVTTAPHGLSSDRIPSMLGVRFVDMDHLALTIHSSSAGIDVTTLNGDPGDIVRVLGSSGVWQPNSECVLQTTTGYAIVSFTTIDGSNHLQAVTLISGTGTLVNGGAAVQGPDGIEDVEYQVYDFPTSTSIRCLDPGAPRRGYAGAAPRFLTPLNANVANDALAIAAAREGYVFMGGCAIPHATPPSGWRQIVFMASTYKNARQYTITSLDVWYSDDRGTTWARGPILRQNATMTLPFLGISPTYDPITGYVYGIAYPNAIAVRFHPNDALTLANWEWLDPAGPTWSTTKPTSGHRLWTDDIASNAIALWWCAKFSCWIALYGDAFGSLIFRTAPAIHGPWSGRRLVWTGADFPTQGLAYTGGSSIHPLSGVAPNNDSSFYFHATMLGAYQGVLFELALFDTALVDPMSEEMHNTRTRVGANRTIGENLERPTLFNTKGWKVDTGTWTRTGANTLTRAGDATDHIGFLDKVRINDGTADRHALVGSIAYVGGGTDTTTLTLIPNNQGASAGNILSAGTLGPLYYSQEATPYGFPAMFTRTPGYTGWVATPTFLISSYGVVDGKIWEAFLVSGTGTGTTRTVTLARAAKTGKVQAVVVSGGTDNAVNVLQTGSLTGGSTTLTLGKSIPGGAWNNGGSCSTQMGVLYEAE